MTKHLSPIFLLLAFALLLPSCNTRKDVAILQNMKTAKSYPIEPRREIVVQENDLLNIIVSSQQPELALPFNISNSTITVDSYGGITTESNGGDSEKGYRVDINGNITFPVLGKIHVEGMYLPQVEDEIRQRIIDGKYIKDPDVSVELKNFKITLLGATGPTVINVDGDRITLLEAIAQGGDINPRGDIKKVSVIRTIDGNTVREDLDLRDVEIFSSPYYYLLPNDIVYAEPRYRERDATSSWMHYSSLFISTASLITTSMMIIKR